MSKESLNYVLLISITLVSAVVLYLILRKLLDVFIKNFSKKLNVNPTHFSFLKNSVGFLIFTIAFIFIFYKIPYLKSIGKALFAGAGVIAVVIGFASQKAFSNIISGIFILIFKPFKVTDTIQIKDGKQGVVEEITLRHTIIRNYENRRIIIPNSIISEETVINSNIIDEKIRKHIIFSISYDSDIDKAMNIIKEEAIKHPLIIDNRTDEEKNNNEPVIVIRVIALTDFSVNIKAWIWSNSTADAFILECDLLKSVKERFDKEGVEIPFPYRTIVYKKDILNHEEVS